LALDVTRGVAVLGILVMNIWSFGWPKQVFDYPPILAQMEGATTATWAVIYTLFEGSQRALFSLLFGIGALMILTRLGERFPSKHVRSIYYRRTGLLVLLGLIDAYIFMWPADILYVYGLAGLCLYPLRHASLRKLAIIALLIFSVPTLIRFADYNAVIASKADPVAWQQSLAEARPKLSDADVQTSIKVMQSGSFGDVFKKQAVGSLILQTIVTVKWWFLDALGTMVIGMILFRLGILPQEKPAAEIRRTIKRMALLGYGIGLPVSIMETYRIISSDFAPDQHAIAAFTYDIGRLAMAAGHLSLILMLCQSTGWQRAKQTLAAVGRMALSNYLSQSILCGLIFYSFGLGLYGKLPGFYLYMVVALIWATQLWWSKRWLARFRFGPFEWLWRSLTYGKKQPMRRAPPA